MRLPGQTFMGSTEHSHPRNGAPKVQGPTRFGPRGSWVLRWTHNPATGFGALAEAGQRELAFLTERKTKCCSRSIAGEAVSRSGGRRPLFADLIGFEPCHIENVSKGFEVMLLGEPRQLLRKRSNVESSGCGLFRWTDACGCHCNPSLRPPFGAAGGFGFDNTSF
jgi:hypothetical protein